MTIQTYNFHEKQALIKHLAKIYHKQCVVLQYKSNMVIKENNEIYQYAFHYIHFIDATLELLAKEHKDLIVNDFFGLLDRGWWQQYYSKTTYYRIKANAMNEFLRCL